MITKEYVAGFFDGEGTIGIAANKIKGGMSCGIRASFCNTNIEVLKIIQLRYAGRIKTHHPYNPQWNTAYALVLSTNAIKELIEDIKDLVIVKAPQIRLAIEFLEFQSSGRDRDRNKDLEFKGKMHILNKTGKIA